MSMVNGGFISDPQVYTGIERRSARDRRQRPDQRNSVRFDASGGDRRAEVGRRSYDVSFQVLE